MCVREIQCSKEGGGTPGAVVEAEVIRGPSEGNGGSDFCSGKGAAATVIRQA